MDIDEKGIIFMPSSMRVVEGLAEQAGTDLETYVQESIDFGKLCAEITAKNMQRGCPTYIFFERTPNSFEQRLLDFTLPLAEAKVEASPAELPKDPFDDEVNHYFGLDPALWQELSDLVATVGGTIPSFVDMAVSLMWHYHLTQAAGGKVLISDGPDMCIELGEIDEADE